LDRSGRCPPLSATQNGKLPVSPTAPFSVDDVVAIECGSGNAPLPEQARSVRAHARGKDDETLLESSFVVPTECFGEGAATVRALGPT
jgi:hypothetical protein